MVKLYQNDHIFHHPFDTVTSAFWRKYPNDQASHVKAIDVYSRSINTQGQLVVHRLMRCESNIPSWLSSLGVSNSAYAAETTVVDPHNQTMCIKSRNITGASMMVVEETCVYKPTSNNKQHTQFTQSARIAAFLPFVSRKIEQYTHSNMTEKAPLGVKVIETLCQNIKNKGFMLWLDEIFTFPSLTKPTDNNDINQTISA